MFGRSIAISLLLTAAVLSFTAAPAFAGFLYFDVNGRGQGSGVTNSGTYGWTNDWNPSSDGHATFSQDWTASSDAVFSAGTDANGLSYTVTSNNTLNVHNLTVQSGTVTLSGTGSFTLSAAATWAVNSSANSLTDNLAINNGGYLFTIANSGSTVINGAITGAGGLTKTGSSTLTLNASNGYSGGTTVSAGTLVLGNNNAMGTDRLTVSSTLDMAGYSPSVTTLSGNGTIGNSSTTNDSVISTSGVSTFSGVLQNVLGSGTRKTGLTVNGGNLTLGGADAYSGNTSVSAGTLTLGSAGSFNNTPIITVSSGAKLDVSAKSGFSILSGQTIKGNGTVNGATTIAAGGHLAPGNSSGALIGTLGWSGNLTLSGYSDFELGTPGASHASPGLSDQTSDAGNLTLGGTLDLLDNAGANSQGSAAAGAYRLFTWTGTQSGGFGSVVDPTANLHAKVTADTTGKAVYVDLYRLASAGSVATPVTLANQHVGGSLRQALTMSNGATGDGFSEGLDAIFGSLTGNALNNGGSISNLAGGGSDNTSMTVGVDTTSAGAKTGTVTINLTSDGTNSGHTNTSLSSQIVTVNGTVYRLAAANTISDINLSRRHVGDGVTQALTVANVAVNDGFSEKLDVAFGGHSSGLTTNGSVALLAPGGTDNAGLVVGIDTGAPGAKSGTVLVTLSSDGSGTSGLGTTTLGTQTITVHTNVNQYAQPQFAKAAGQGVLTEIDASHYILDFGSVLQHTGTKLVSLNVLNALLDPTYQDALGGSFDASGISRFGLLNAGAFSGVGPGGNKANGLGLTFDTDTLAPSSYSETFFMTPTWTDDSGSGSLAPIQVTMIGTVAVPEPGTLALFATGALAGAIVWVRRQRAQQRRPYM